MFTTATGERGRRESRQDEEIGDECQEKCIKGTDARKKRDVSMLAGRE